MCPPPSTRCRNAEPRHAHQAEHVRLDHLALVLLVRFPDRIAAAREPRVVDEDVEAAELGDGARHELLARGAVGDVERAVPAGAGHDPCPRSGQRLRGRGTDAARPPGDDRPFALQIHHARNLAVRGAEPESTKSALRRLTSHYPCSPTPDPAAARGCRCSESGSWCCSASSHSPAAAGSRTTAGRRRASGTRATR